MKKIIYMIFSALIIVSLIGCGVESIVTSEETTTEDTASEVAASSDYAYPVVDTAQGICYNNSEVIECPAEGEAFYGQDAQYTGNVPSYTDNGDSTVTDNVTGLMWSQDDNGEAINWEAALVYAEAATTAGYDDWRLPNVKELQSIADYSGVFPAINTSVFNLTKLTNIKDQTDYPFYWSSTSNPVEGSDGEVDSGFVYAWVLAAGYITQTLMVTTYMEQAQSFSPLNRKRILQKGIPKFTVTTTFVWCAVVM